MEGLRQRLAKGEQSAFAELYDLFASRLYRYLTVRLSSAHDAADVMQEVFVRLARSRKQFAMREGDLAGYIFAIAHNEAARLLGKRAQQDRVAAAHANVIERVSHADRTMELTDSVRFALASISDEQREVVTMKIYGALTFSEIAEAIGLPQGTVASRYRAALVQMRELLARNEK